MYFGSSVSTIRAFKFRMRLCLVLLCISAAWRAEAAKILGIFPMPSHSHYVLGHAFMKGLAERGHDVTMVSPFENKEAPKNGSYRDVVLTGFKEIFEERRKDMNFFDRAESSPFLMVTFINLLMVETTELFLKHENVQKLLNSEERFDAVIVEQFMNEGCKAVASHFGAPLVLFSTVAITKWIDPLVGNVAPLSYSPEALAEPEGPRMTFWERAKNVAVHAYAGALTRLYLHPKHAKLVKRYVPTSAPLQEILYNASLALINGHNSINPAMPRVPAMIDIGGFHIQPPKKLPRDLQEFLDNSTEGVVYFSMGSNLKSAQMHAGQRDVFLKAFAKLKQKVLWKWEEDTLPGQPPNLKLGKWLPQQDILAHPNVKLFITHGGYLSTCETVYHGVPVLAIPIFGDQKANSKIAVNAGFGLALSYRKLSEEALTGALDELLTNPKYAYNAKKTSKIFHDRPMGPLETGIYWVEYVIRNDGARHLRVAGLDLPWYQYHLLDVAALFIAVGLAVLYVNFLVARAVLRAICRRFCKSTKKNEDQENEKKKQQ